MFVRIVVIALIVIMPFIASGCQVDDSSLKPVISYTPLPTPVASDTPQPATPTIAHTPTIEQPTLSIPQGEPATIDGSMAPGEWDNARVETFSDSSRLLLMQSQGYLYLGIQASDPGMIIGNVFLYRGDEIAILHSSAALGTALYQKEADGWQQTQPFAWRCRKTDNSQAAQDERTEFFEQGQWIAANAYMGTPNELEFQIKITGDTLRLAATYIRASNPNVKIPWPATLDDDCIKPTSGGLPKLLDFSPDQWGTINFPSFEGD